MTNQEIEFLEIRSLFWKEEGEVWTVHDLCAAGGRGGGQRHCSRKYKDYFVMFQPNQSKISLILEFIFEKRKIFHYGK